MNQYSKDEDGQWWAHVYRKDGTLIQNARVEPRTCPQCGEEFVTRGKQAYCSRSCSRIAAAAQRRAAQEKASPLPTAPQGQDTYWQDESGQWFCIQKRKKLRADGQPITVRLKVYPQTCEQCGEEFVNRHKQKLCSRACQSKWEVGRPKKEEPPRECPICGGMYERKIRRPWRKTCSPKCARALAEKHPGYLPVMSGADNPNWTGGKRLQSKSGYIYVYAGPGLDSRLEHRVVMEQMVGRPLQRYEEVHHRNAVRNDNRPENLELWVKRQPGGARAEDLVEYAHWILETYGPLQGKLF